MHERQEVEIFGNISTALFWYAGRPLTSKRNFTEIVPEEPSIGGIKHKRGSNFGPIEVYISAAVQDRR